MVMARGAVVRWAELAGGVCRAALTRLPGARSAAPRRNAILTLSYLGGLLGLWGLVGQMLV